MSKNSSNTRTTSNTPATKRTKRSGTKATHAPKTPATVTNIDEAKAARSPRKPRLSEVTYALLRKADRGVADILAYIEHCAATNGNDTASYNDHLAGWAADLIIKGRGDESLRDTAHEDLLSIVDDIYPDDATHATSADEAQESIARDDDDEDDDRLALRIPVTCREALLHCLAASGDSWRQAAEALTSAGRLHVAIHRYSAAAGSYEDAAECAASADGMSDEERQLFIAEALDAAAWMRDAVAQTMRREEIESGAREAA